MMDSKDYVPTLIEWDALAQLWSRSKTAPVARITTGVVARLARLAWTTKNFVDAHPGAPARRVYAWLEKSTLTQTASGAVRGTHGHDAPTTRIPCLEPGGLT